MLFPFSPLKPVAVAVAAALLLLPNPALAATPDEWRNRTIYQLLTDRFATTNLSTTQPCPAGIQDYCGGTWQGIVGELDYIQGMGFDAIWISPVTKQIDDPSRSWHGYSQNDLFQVNSHFGSPEDLMALSSALHARGMYLMVDVVANHFGADGPANAIDYTTMSPFNTPSFFHTTPLCFITDYNNQTDVEDCWLGTTDFPLPDVNTTRPDVRQTYQTWIQQLVANYSIDGLRIDTVKHVEKPFWPLFNDAAGVYAVGEVADGDIDYACAYQGFVDGILNYPAYYQITQFFQSPANTSTDLVNLINGMKETCNDTTLLGSFSENHDQPRFPSLNNDTALDKNVIAYTILADGIPIIYAGQEQHYSGTNDPFNREATWLAHYNTSSPFYTFIASLTSIRKTAIAADTSYLTTKASVVYTDPHTIGIQKGSVLSVYSNNGAGAGTYTVQVTSNGFNQGTSLVDILNCGSASNSSTVTVGEGGVVSVAVPNGGLPVVLMPSDMVTGKGVCGL